MRTGTILVLLGLIFMVAFFGWQALGVLALSLLLVLLVAVGVVAWAMYRIRRRMRETMEEAARAFGQALAAQQGAARRSDAIDVQATVRKPRDGADEPESLDDGPR